LVHLGGEPIKYNPKNGSVEITSNTKEVILKTELEISFGLC
jgi:hypothetical protein